MNNRISYGLSIALCLILTSVAPAAIITSGGGLALAENGGTFAASNLAASATAFAPDIEGNGVGVNAGPPQPTGYSGFHTTTGVNNGAYGNPGAWLAGTPNSYIGLNLGGSFSVSSIAYGRDNNGAFGDRAAGLVTLEYTNDAVPGLASTWTTIGTMDYTVTGAYEADRHRFDFNPVTATGLRLVTASAGRGIDEFEVYSASVGAFLTTGVPVIQNEVGPSTATTPGAPIPTEPSPGEGQYRYVNGGGSFTWTPLLTGENVNVETSWGVSFNHTQDADYFFDPDGPSGPMPEIALSQTLNQTKLADQTTTPGGVEWSGFYTIGSGLTISPASVFRVTGTNVPGGSSPEALSTAVWRFTAVPEPSTFGLCVIGSIAAIALGRGRRQSPSGRTSRSVR